MLRIPCADVPAGTFRPLTGVIKPNRQIGGNGEMTIENGTSRDGVIALTLSEVPVVTAYIRTGDSVTLKGISDGTYQLYFSKGAGWDGEEFLAIPSFQRFVNVFRFSTTSTTYITWNVTLHGVIDGRAAAEEVDRSKFLPIAE
jgi:hypothetical protein